MKKTLNVNVGGQSFVLDEDAYESLGRYLAEIELRLESPEGREVLEDIEARVADIFSENLSTRVQVVSLEVVRRAMAILGPAGEFGEPRRPAVSAAEGVPAERGRYTRSLDDRILGGVCGGLAAYYHFDPLLVRILSVVLTVLLGGAPVAVYLVLWIAMPASERTDRRTESPNR